MEIRCTKREQSIFENTFIAAGWDTNTAFEETGFTSKYEMRDLEIVIDGVWME